MTAIGSPLRRIEGPDKVTGTARYAVDYPASGVAYVWPVQAPVARGTVRSVDSGAVLAMPGVLAVLWHGNAPRLADVPDHELLVFQRDRVAYHGQFVAAVVAESLEAARAAADRTPVHIDEQRHDTELRADREDLFTPEKVNPNYESDTAQGDVDAELAASAVTVDVTYETAATHNNPMEPHASTAQWLGDRLLVHDSNQGATGVAQTLATLFGLDEDQVQVVSAHVGGGFGAKGTARPNVVLAAMAARVVGRPVRLALSRQHQFSVVGYRTPTIQRIRLGAGADGVLRAISHEAIEQTSTVREFAEQTAVGTRMMYAAASRRTAHKLARLDVPTPAWMRAPGEAPGMYALESAMDELAVACGLDPIELRVRNEPDVDPESGHPFSSRNLVACLRDGASRFGWADRDPRPGVRRDGRWLVGTGVAAATYPARSRPASAAARMLRDGRFQVEINATDIGTGARTVLGQVAADALGVPPDRVEMRVGDSTLPPANLAGGSMGTASWSWAVDKAARELRSRMAAGVPEGGLEVRVDTEDDIAAQDRRWSRHAFWAHFAEVPARSGRGSSSSSGSWWSRWPSRSSTWSSSAAGGRITAGAEAARPLTVRGVETVTLRALMPADAPALTRLLAEIEAVDATGEHFSEDDVADELADSSVNLARDTLTAVGADGCLLGWTVVRSSPNVTDLDRVWLEGGVLPARRGEGLGRRLLEWAERRGVEMHQERHPSVSGQVFVRVPETVPAQQALVRAAGYRPIRYWYDMTRDLSAPLPPVPAAPAGLRVVPWSSSLDEALRLAHGEAFSDHWGSTRPDQQRWAQWYTGSRGFQPPLSRLVLDGDRIAAYALGYFFAADAVATGVREAYVGQVGTLRPWRRRGLGTLLLATALGLAREHGYARAALTVDSSNPTGALGLYERAGFTVRHEAVTWTKPVG